MKNKISPLVLAVFTMLAALAIVFSIGSFGLIGTAQVPTSASENVYTGASCVATTTTTKNLVIDCSKQANVGVVISQKASGASNSNMVYTFKRSVDGSTYDTVGTTVTVVGNGATQVTVLTNLPSWGANYIKLTTYAWDDPATFCTNMSMSYGVKISTP